MGKERGEIAARAFDACDRIARANSIVESKRLLIQEMKWFGFDYLTCTVMPAPGHDPLKGFLLNTRPQSYVQNYAEQGHVLVDPAVTELKHSLRPFSWSDVKQRRVLSKRELSILEEGRQYEMYDGFTIPIVTTSGPLSLVFPCGRCPDLSIAARSAVELIAITGLQCLKRLNLEQSRCNNEGVGLSPREREVLQWVLAGKTDDEIGDILSIANSTVRRHADNAMMKLGVFRRTVAVAEALRRGEIFL